MVLQGDNISLGLKFGGAIITSGLSYYFVYQTPSGENKSESGVLLSYNIKKEIWEKSSYNDYEDIKTMIISNLDNTSHTIWVYIGDTVVYSFLLEVGEKASYESGAGFVITSIDGLPKTDAEVVVSGVTDSYTNIFLLMGG